MLGFPFFVVICFGSYRLKLFVAAVSYVDGFPVGAVRIVEALF
jgi:hypothetical protein